MIAIRGAVRVPRNDARSIHAETRALLEEMQRRNRLDPGRIVSAFFTMTPDLDADFPAHAARQLGWDRVPMLGAQETAVPGAPDRMVRVLLHADLEGPARHVYLGEAAVLRPDLSERLRALGEVSQAMEAPEPGLDPVLIIGLGLIGGSLGLALCRAGVEVHGVDSDRATRDRATAIGAVLEAGLDPAPYLDRVGTIVLAIPVPEICRWLIGRGPRLMPGTVVMDVGSTKRVVVEAMNGLPTEIEAIATHPMAGSERSGIGAADVDLFLGCEWAIVPCDRSGPRAISVAETIVRLSGAIARRIGPEAHDRAAALTSHAPYLVSVVLRRLGDLHTSTSEGLVTGPAWKDMTRLARCDPKLFSGILATNWHNVRGVLERLRESIAEFEESVESLAGDTTPTRDSAAVLPLLLGLVQSEERRLGSDRGTS